MFISAPAYTRIRLARLLARLDLDMRLATENIGQETNTTTGDRVLAARDPLKSERWGRVCARLLDPQPQRQDRQIEIACDRAETLALIKDQPNRLCLELIRVMAARPRRGCVCCYCGRRICLPESVHAIGLRSMRSLRHGAP